METAMFDIPTFCKSFKISRALLNKLIKEGKGPQVIKVGRRTLISAKAAKEWREKLEGQIGQPGLAITLGLRFDKRFLKWLCWFGVLLNQMIQ